MVLAFFSKKTNAPSLGKIGGNLGRRVALDHAVCLTCLLGQVRHFPPHGRFSLFFQAYSSQSGREGIVAAAMLRRPDAAACPSATPSAGGGLLAPFDQLMLVDARPGHPMCFFLECIVEGDLDEERLRKAVDQAAQRHPRFCSRVAWRGGRPYWLVADVQPAFVWQPQADGIDPWRLVDLERESGVRIVARAIGPRLHSIVMVVHHSVCDGIAACEFMGDLWACYEGIEPRGFSRPAMRGGERPEPASEEQPPAIDAVGEALAFARFFPKALASRRSAAAEPPRAAVEPPYASIEIDEAFTSRLRSAAASRKATVNDLIVAAVMRAAIAWNDRAGRRRGGVRVTMPVSTRAPRQHEPASNEISYAFLDRSRDACRDRESLVSSLAAASRWILASGAVAGFLEAVRFLSKSPFLLKAVTRLPICLSTVIVSNLGDVSRRMRAGVPKIDGRDAPGGLIIRGFRGVPPLRPRTRASVAVLPYAGTTTICCLCSAGSDSRAAGREFLELIRRELEGFE